MARMLARRFLPVGDWELIYNVGFLFYPTRVLFLPFSTLVFYLRFEDRDFSWELIGGYRCLIYFLHLMKMLPIFSNGASWTRRICEGGRMFLWLKFLRTGSRREEDVLSSFHWIQCHFFLAGFCFWASGVPVWGQFSLHTCWSFLPFIWLCFGTGSPSCTNSSVGFQAWPLFCRDLLPMFGVWHFHPFDAECAQFKLSIVAASIRFFVGIMLKTLFLCGLIALVGFL